MPTLSPHALIWSVLLHRTHSQVEKLVTKDRIVEVPVPVTHFWISMLMPAVARAYPCRSMQWPPETMRVRVYTM